MTRTHSLSRLALVWGFAACGAMACGGDGGPEAPSASGPWRAGDACGRGAAVGELRGELEIDGQKRSYLAHVPARAKDQALPAVLAFHGDGGSAERLQASLGFERVSGEDALVVYLDGAKDLDTQGDANADLRYVDAVLDELQSRYCLSDVYAFGYSRGGYFVNHLACYRGQRLTAIASHSAGGPYSAPYKDGVLQCPASKGVAAMVIHGLADPVVAVSEGDKSINYWSERLGCDGGRTPDGELPPCELASGCELPLEVCKVPGLDHSLWSEAVPSAWRFFQRAAR